MDSPVDSPVDSPLDSPRPRFGLLVPLLFGLLLVVLLTPSFRPHTEVQQVMGPPPVVAPTGALAEAFDLGRPASVRIEARCAGARGPAGTLGIGTGFFIRDDGLLLTAYHVVDASGALPPCPVVYQAVTPEQERYPLEIVGFDAYFDLALMRADVDDTQVAFIPLAADEVTPGDPVVAIGNSRDDFLAARSGRVSRLGVRAARADFADDTIELTASLAPGDSGGPVLNRRGEAVGVVSYISFNPAAMESDTFVPPFLRGVPQPSEFASYAVPVSSQSELVSALLDGVQRDVPVIGLSWSSGFDSAYDPRSSGLDLGRRPGTVVEQVAPGGPAEEAGVRAFSQRALLDTDGRRVGSEVKADVIVAIDGEPTRDFMELLEVVRARRIGEVITLRVQRGDATFDLELVLGAKRDVFGQR